ncbi:hypothetical protein [Marinobacter sp. NSM]|uniref:hypothetical protein n=1 Tax=Marinobacter sp. NSM TaxID=3458004 RepID=UPI0040373FEA
MSYRTDLKYEGGKLAVNDTAGADTRKTLPKVEGTDLLTSDRFGESWQRAAGVDDLSLSALGNAHSAIARTFQSTVERRETVNPEMTQAKHLNILASDFNRAMDNLAQKATAAQKQAADRLDGIEREFRETVKWNEKDAAELRQVLRGMSENDRKAAISKAIQDGDGQLLAATLGAHPTLSGVSGDLQQAFRAQAMHTHRPDLLKLEKALRQAKEQTSQAFTQLLERSEALTAKQVREQYAAEADKAAQAQKKAQEKDADIWRL